MRFQSSCNAVQTSILHWHLAGCLLYFIMFVFSGIFAQFNLEFALGHFISSHRMLLVCTKYIYYTCMHMMIFLFAAYEHFGWFILRADIQTTGDLIYRQQAIWFVFGCPKLFVSFFLILYLFFIPVHLHDIACVKQFWTKPLY